MLTDVLISGFKSLEQVHLQDLRQVNVIVGRSASGKTALLEAIRVGLSGLPSTMWNVASSRGGFMFLPQPPTRDQFESIWRPYFFDFDISKSIDILMSDDRARSASVKVLFDPEAVTSSAGPVFPGMPPIVSSINPLSFERSSFDGVASYARASLNQQGHMNFEPAAELGIASEMFTSSTQINVSQVANWFSALSINDEEHDLVGTVREAFPLVGDLSVQAPQGVPQIYASLKSPRRKLPLTSISSGINKFVSLLIAMQTLSDGVVLIDEIENGIYFEMYPILWATLARYASRNRVQVFATTHSLECLDAAAAVLQPSASVYSILQVYQEQGKTEVRELNGRDASNAIKGGIEVRA